MDWLTKMLSEPTSILLVALVFFTAVVVIVLLRALSHDEAFRARLDDVEESLKRDVSMAMVAGDRNTQRSREELSGNLRGMGDSVTRVMGEMVRAQESQLDSFTSHLREMGRVDEQRMNELRATLEQRLTAYDHRMDRIGDMLDDKLNQNEGRVERLRQSVERQLEGIRADNGARLEEMRRAVDERLGATLDRRLGESFRLVNDRLEQVHHSLGEMRAISGEVGDLTRVLTNVKARGLLGEVQLGGILEQVMSAEQYVPDAVLRAGGPAVSYAVKVPGHDEGEDALLPIDAGFSYEVYRELLDAAQMGDQARAQALSARLEEQIRARAALIREQFIAPPLTTPFAVLFLPMEGLYAEALRMPALAERLQREDNVTLAGPATITALLNSLQMGFRTLALEKRSVEVWGLLGEVRGEFSQFAHALARTQEALHQATASIEDAARKSHAIEHRLQAVRRPDGAEAQLTAVAAISPPSPDGVE